MALPLLLLLLLTPLSALPLCTPTTPNPPPDTFCTTPPTFPINATLYSGNWYQIYGSGSALPFSSAPCTTATYTLQSNGSLSVLNCSYNGTTTLPQCTPGIADPNPAADNSGKLIVSFPTRPPGPGNPANYNVATVLRDLSGKYLAAAVYQCLQFGGRNRPGFYILSRTPLFAPIILEVIKAKLGCMGYDTSDTFVPIEFTDQCKFSFQDGFELRS